VELARTRAPRPVHHIRLGGKARYFVECGSRTRSARPWHTRPSAACAAYVLGGGSNVVFLDSGFPDSSCASPSVGSSCATGRALRCAPGAGVDWDTLVQNVVQRGWNRGRVPVWHSGHGRRHADTKRGRLRARDLREPGERRMPRPHHARSAGPSPHGSVPSGIATAGSKRADRGRYVVLEVTLRLARDQRPRIRYPELQRPWRSSAGSTPFAPGEAVRLVREAVLALRRRKSMVLDPADPNTARPARSSPIRSCRPPPSPTSRSAGRRIPSFPADGGVKVPAAWLVEHAGFSKGYRGGAGRAGISTRHALALGESRRHERGSAGAGGGGSGRGRETVRHPARVRAGGGAFRNVRRAGGPDGPGHILETVPLAELCNAPNCYARPAVGARARPRCLHRGTRPHRSRSRLRHRARGPVVVAVDVSRDTDRPERDAESASTRSTRAI